MNVHDPAHGVVNAATATQASTQDALPIYEVARQLGIAQHVLRTWENRFPQLQPIRGQSGRRLYRADDVDLLRRISDMLYVRHLSLGEVQRILAGGEGAQDRADAVMAPVEAPRAASDSVVTSTAVEITDVQVEEVEAVIVREQVQAAPPEAQAPVACAAPPPETAPVAENDASIAPVPTSVAASVPGDVETAPPIEAVTVPPDHTPVLEPTTSVGSPPVQGETPPPLMKAPVAPVVEAAVGESEDALPPIGSEAGRAVGDVPVGQASVEEAQDEEPPLEQLVMLELERLRSENGVLREHLRGVLVELEALREMVPV